MQKGDKVRLIHIWENIPAGTSGTVLEVYEDGCRVAFDKNPDCQDIPRVVLYPPLSALQPGPCMRIFSAQEISESMGLSKSTVYRRIASGDLNGKKVNGRYIIILDS